MSCPVNFTHTVQFLFFLLIYELPCELYPYGAVALLTLLILTLRCCVGTAYSLYAEYEQSYMSKDSMSKVTLRCCVGTAALLSRRSEETQRARRPSSQQHH